MTSVSAEPVALGNRSLVFRGRLGWQALTFAFLAAGLAVGLLVPVPDVSWLLITGERVLHGQRLYSQVIEVNPPLSVLLYEPAVILSDWLGLKPEPVVGVLCTLGVLASLGLSGAVLKPLIGDDPARRWKLAAAGAFALCVLPAVAFGEREHIAVMALLPFVAATILRGEGRSLRWMLAIPVGLALGLAISIKPHFAAIAALPALWAMLRARRVRPWAQAELWVAAAIFVGYWTWAVTAYPDYFTRFMPVLREVYLPIRSSFLEMITLPAVPAAAAGYLVARSLKLGGPWMAAPMLAAVGGGIAYLAQCKGWPYQAYPMNAFAALGLMAPAAMAQPAQVRAWRLLDCFMLLFPSLVAIWWLSSYRDPGPLAREVAAVAPPSPRIITITGNLGIGIPLVPAIHARWVGTSHSEWVSEGALRREERGGLSPTTEARLDQLMDQDRNQLARDIQVGRPDVILVEHKKFDWRAWALQNPVIASEFAHYRFVGKVREVEVWARKWG
jgi:hypothetical protein